VQTLKLGGIGEVVQAVAAGGLDECLDLELVEQAAHRVGDLGKEVEAGGRRLELQGVGVEDLGGFLVDLVVRSGISMCFSGCTVLQTSLHMGHMRKRAFKVGILDMTYLLVDGEQSDTVLAAFGVRFGVHVLVRAPAIEHDRLADDTLLGEVVAVDAGANLLGELEEREGFGGLDDDGLLALVRTFGEDNLTL
jgi:hypothetical protein